MPNSTLHLEAMREAQAEILHWFTSDMRITLAAVSSEQKAFTVASVTAGLSAALLEYEKRTLLGPVTDQQETRAFLFRASFEKLSREILLTLGSGLTHAEVAALKLPTISSEPASVKPCTDPEALAA